MRLRAARLGERGAAAARAAARAAYERAWAALPAREGTLEASVLPWPCNIAEINAARVAETVLPPALDGAARRKLLQAEQRRWHPDKFTSKWSARLRDEQREEVLARVLCVSQALNQLLQEESGVVLQSG